MLAADTDDGLYSSFPSFWGKEGLPRPRALTALGVGPNELVLGVGTARTDHPWLCLCSCMHLCIYFGYYS
jgi:hypothetical protein